MNRELLDKINHQLWDVLADYSKGFKSEDDVETVKHALSGIFKIRCLEEMEDFKQGSYRGGSRDGGYNDGSSYRYYDEGSFARGGGSRDGRSMNRFSRDGAMREKLGYLLQDATDERQRQVIREMMNRI